MHATRLTFFRVARHVVLAEPLIRPGVDEVSPFLVAHVNDLRERAANGSTAKAAFLSDVDRQLMEDLRRGSDDVFLAAAGVLGARLVQQMNPMGAASPGLFVCATIESDDDPVVRYAAVLKLEVVSAQGAILKRLESGEETLAAVTDVLDQPGKLQKGLVFRDFRPGSEAVVGDKLAQHEARYFLRAMGVRLQAHDGASARALVSAVAEHAGQDVANRVVEALPTVNPAPTGAVLTALRAVIPELTEESSTAVATALATAERPVVLIDTAAPVTATMRAGSLRLSGPADAVGAASVLSDPEGGWWVRFHSDEEPTITFR
jgi:hypothetical protein